MAIIEVKIKDGDFTKSLEEAGLDNFELFGFSCVNDEWYLEDEEINNMLIANKEFNDKLLACKHITDKDLEELSPIQLYEKLYSGESIEKYFKEFKNSGIMSFWQKSRMLRLPLVLVFTLANADFSSLLSAHVDYKDSVVKIQVEVEEAKMTKKNLDKLSIKIKSDLASMTEAFKVYSLTRHNIEFFKIEFLSGASKIEIRKIEGEAHD